MKITLTTLFIIESNRSKLNQVKYTILSNFGKGNIKQTIREQIKTSISNEIRRNYCKWKVWREEEIWNEISGNGTVNERSHCKWKLRFKRRESTNEIRRTKNSYTIEGSYIQVDPPLVEDIGREIEDNPNDNVYFLRCKIVASSSSNLSLLSFFFFSFLSVCSLLSPPPPSLFIFFFNHDLLNIIIVYGTRMGRGGIYYETGNRLMSWKLAKRVKNRPADRPGLNRRQTGPPTRCSRKDEVSSISN